VLALATDVTDVALELVLGVEPQPANSPATIIAAI
jgi:hypothetical protein